MKWTNYHSHTHFSDGKGEPELYAQSAVEHKMYAYGYSCHSPVPFESGWNMKFEKLAAYLKEINRLKDKYREQLKIFLGLEIDYVKDLCGIEMYKNQYQLDYTIGGVHFLGQFENGRFWDFDGGKPWFRKGLEELFDNDIKKLVEYYYEQVTDMVLSEKPDVVAHFDLIKKYNKGNSFFNEQDKWYKDIAFAALEKVAKTNTILEVNTRGVLKQLDDEFFPSNFILDRCREIDVPVCLSADSHDANDVMALLPEAREQLLKTGYSEVYLFDEKGWNASPIV